MREWGEGMRWGEWVNSCTVTLIRSVRLQEFPFHTNNTLPTSKMKESPAFIAAQLMSISRILGQFLPFTCSRRLFIVVSTCEKPESIPPCMYLMEGGGVKWGRRNGCRREWSGDEDGVLERVKWGRRRGARESGVGAKAGC